MALLQMYVIKDGKVTYRNRFLKSDAYRKNMKAQRIVVTSFGMRAHRDPCMTLLRRFTNYFTAAGLVSDNDLVSFYEVEDKLYAVGDTPLIRRVDPVTLKSQEKVDLRKFVSVTATVAHAHTDKNGNSYNIGSHFGCYNIIMFPKDGGFESGRIVASIPTKHPLNPSYYHSFLMTDNYFVFIEQPLVISIKSTMWRHFTFKSYDKMLKWKPQYKTRFHIVERASGKVLKQKYYAAPFAFFHTINAYEDCGHLVVDICCYEDGKIMETTSLEAIRFSTSSASETERHLKSMNSRARRYVLPIMNDKHIKVDTMTKECSYWFADDCFPAEPVFVARPSAILEDEGVILTTVVSLKNDHETFLLILDASTFKEVARASVTLQSPIPASFHAKFLTTK
ncbi:Carotenoid isomerooxygenase [Halotydeus destructor]|nr:Carotenoid isomerooxygenase [Halotydeus destructor]